MRNKTVAARLLLARSACALAISSCALATAAVASETITYSYDALGRLVATTSSGGVNNGLTTGIAYDPAGNRRSYTVSGTGGGTAIVADYSFENPPLGGSGYVNAPAVAGLSFTGWSGITSNSSDWSYTSAPDGSQAAFLSAQNSGIATMSLAISGLTVGSAYRVAFMMARRPLYNVPNVHVSIDGTTLGDYSPVASTTSFNAFTTPAFTATASTATLTFAATTLGDVAIDKVTVGP